MAMGKRALLSVRIASIADNSGFRKATREIGLLEKKLKVMQRALNTSSSRLGRFTSAVSSVVAPVARMTTMATAATVAIGGLAAPLAATGVAAGAAIGPMIKLGAAMAPAAIGSAALAFGTLRASLAGFGTALEAANAEEFAAAIADMGPAAQAGATALYGLKQTFADVGKAVQETFWANLSNIGDLGALVAPIRSAMNALAADMGNAAAGLVAFVSHGTGLTAMRTLMSASGEAAANLSYAVADVLRGVVAVGAAAAPVFVELTQRISEAAAAWADRMVAGFADGSLQQTFEQALSAATAFGTVLGQLGGIIAGVFTAAAAAGQPFLGGIAEGIRLTNEWVNSLAGQTALRDFFASTAAAVQALLPVLFSLAETVATTIAPPVSQAITIAGPALAQLADAFGVVMAAVAPVIPEIAQAAAQLASGLAVAATNVAPLLGDLARLIANGLGNALGQASTLIVRFSRFIAENQTLVGSLTVAVGVFVGALQAVRMVTNLVMGLKTAWGLLNIVMRANPIGLIVTALGAVVTGLTYAYQHSERFRNFINLLGNFAATVFRNIEQWLINRVVGAIANVIDWVGSLISWLRSAWDWVTSLGREQRKNSQVRGELQASAIPTPGLTMMQAAYTPVSPIAPLPRLSPSTTVINVNVEVSGAVGDEAFLADTIRRAMDRTDRIRGRRGVTA